MAASRRRKRAAPTTSKRSTGAGFRIGPGMFARLSYRVFDAEQELVDESDPASPMPVVVGYGQLLPALERALDGLAAGERCTAVLAPRDAYGSRDPHAIIEVDRADFPPDVAAGDRFEAERDDGAVVVLQVIDVAEDLVVLDTNHPLAGQRVQYEVDVLEVRPATAEELDRAVERLEEAPDRPPDGLIPPERLLPGGGRRYESSRRPVGDDDEPDKIA